MAEPLEVLVDMRDLLRDLPEKIGLIVRPPIPERMPLAETTSKAVPVKVDEVRPQPDPVRPIPTMPLSAPAASAQPLSAPRTEIASSEPYRLPPAKIEGVPVPVPERMPALPSVPAPQVPLAPRISESVSPEPRRDYPVAQLPPSLMPNVPASMPAAAVASTPPSMPASSQTLSLPAPSPPSPVFPMPQNERFNPAPVAPPEPPERSDGLALQIGELIGAMKELADTIRSAGGSRGGSAPGTVSRYTAPPKETRQSAPSTYKPQITGQGGAKVSKDTADAVSKLFGRG